MPFLLSIWPGTALQSTLTSVINFKCLFLYANIYIFRARVGWIFSPSPSGSISAYFLQWVNILHSLRLCQWNIALVELCPLSCKAWNGTSSLSSVKTNSRDLHATAPCPSWKERASNNTGWHHSLHSLLVFCRWMGTHPHISGFQKYHFPKTDLKLQLRLE